MALGRPALGAITGLALAAGLVLEMVQSRNGFARGDDAAARWGAAHATGATESALQWITHLGSTPVVVALYLVASIVECRRHPTRAVPAFLATVVASQVIITNLIELVMHGSGCAPSPGQRSVMPRSHHWSR